jgi:membrane carboxypeptidase/penicillin-binding protein PbpC
MITLIFRLISGVLTLSVVALAIGAGYVWYDGSRMMGRAKQNGWLAPAPVEAPLSLFETTVAKGIFGRTWEQKGFPCRTLARMWAYYTGDKSSPPGGLSISQVMARDIAYEVEASQSVGSQVRQLSLACQLEGRSDTELLRLWLPRASFGKGLIGPDAAAQAMFEKAPGTLNASEAAKLAAALSEPGVQADDAEWAAGAQRITQHAQTNQQDPAN